MRFFGIRWGWSRWPLGPRKILRPNFLHFRVDGLRPSTLVYRLINVEKLVDEFVPNGAGRQTAGDCTQQLVGDPTKPVSIIEGGPLMHRIVPTLPGLEEPRVTFKEPVMQEITQLLMGFGQFG